MQFRYLLVARFALSNLIAIGLCLAAYLQGWLDGILTAHLRELSLLILLVFVYGLVLCAGKLWQNSSDLNDIKLKMDEWHRFTQHLSDWERRNTIDA